MVLTLLTPDGESSLKLSFIQIFKLLSKILYLLAVVRRDSVLLDLLAVPLFDHLLRREMLQLMACNIFI